MISMYCYFGGLNSSLRVRKPIMAAVASAVLHWDVVWAAGQHLMWGWGVGKRPSAVFGSPKRVHPQQALPTGLPTAPVRLVFTPPQGCYFWVPITGFCDTYCQQVMIFVWYFIDNSWQEMVSRLCICPTVSNVCPFGSHELFYYGWRHNG